MDRMDLSMPAKSWNLDGRVRFFVNSKGGIEVVPRSYPDSVLQYISDKYAVALQTAETMARGYFSPGRIVFFCGSYFGAWPGLNRTKRNQARGLYKGYYTEEPTIYNGVYKGTVGEEWPPITSWDSRHGWQIANGWCNS